MCKEGFYGTSKCGPHYGTFHGKGFHPGMMADFCGSFSNKDMKHFGQMAHRFMRGFSKVCEGWVPYNLEDKGDNYLIQVPLAGRKKEDIKVSLINDTLNVSAGKPKTPEDAEEKKEEEQLFKRKFFSFVDVNLDIPLPPDANKDDIKSMMQNGLLKVKIGKKPPTNINVGDDPGN
ncbi:MAG: Hsp20/alpha crystallin family protein [Promethearchaeota archaeon]